MDQLLGNSLQRPYKKCRLHSAGKPACFLCAIGKHHLHANHPPMAWLLRTGLANPRRLAAAGLGLSLIHI
eukprot:8084956-Prorocentrum_lima.AAC.1